MYFEVTKALYEAYLNENILCICITGAGDYFTSGNDLAMDLGNDSLEDAAKQKGESFEYEIKINI